jgi:hypothetical protein
MVHSTFRDFEGRQLLPWGLEWGMDGDSHVTYLPADDVTDKIDVNDPLVRRGIIEAHNRWCFAKQIPFKSVDDILSLSSRNGTHIQVNWRDTPRIVETDLRHENVTKLLTKYAEKAKEGGESPEVWVNGKFISPLDGPDAVGSVLEAVSNVPSIKLSLKRSDGFIRVERYFTGGLRDRVQVFDHIMDNLIALEDPQVLDEQTVIGTATLPDWIMGGNLTSRLWTRELDNGNILFLRPLRNDDISTSDRRFELVKGRDDEQIQVVREELSRLRVLASLSHPFQAKDSLSRGPLATVKNDNGRSRWHHKVFGGV